MATPLTFQRLIAAHHLRPGDKILKQAGKGALVPVPTVSKVAIAHCRGLDPNDPHEQDITLETDRGRMYFSRHDCFVVERGMLEQKP